MMKKASLFGLLALVCLPLVASADALTAERNTPVRTGTDIVLGVYTNTRIFAGSMIAVNSSGYAVPAADTAGYNVIGRANETVDNRTNAEGAGTSGVKTIKASRGIFGWVNASSEMTDADIGNIVYVHDDQTVTNATIANGIIAGVLMDIDQNYAWVDTYNIDRTAGSFTTLSISGLAVLQSHLTVYSNLVVHGNSTTTGTHTQVGISTSTGKDVFNGGIAVNEDVTVALDATDEEVSIVTSAEVSGAGASLVTIQNTLADTTVQGYLLNLDRSVDDADVDGDYVIIQDAGGTVFTISQDGDTAIAGALDLTGTLTLGDIEPDGTITVGAVAWTNMPATAAGATNDPIWLKADNGAKTYTWPAYETD